MKKMIAALILMVAVTACGGDNNSVEETGLLSSESNSNQQQTSEMGDIVDVAAGAGSFQTLLAAADAAELVDTLRSEGPFTVFAPTDEAFAALPEGTVETLLKPENKAMLQEILLYHVLAGKVLAEAAVELGGSNTIVDSANNIGLQLSIKEGDLFINESKVIATDVEASNGVIHVIDRVLLPPQMPRKEKPDPLMDIVDTAVNAGSFNTLVAAVKAAGLVETLKGEGPFTVFAPTDAAFAALPEGTVETLLKPENIQTLTDILTYHVLSGAVPAEVAVTLTEAQTVLGQKLGLKVVDGELFINDSKVVVADILTSNGIIHVIDAVLLPAN